MQNNVNAENVINALVYSFGENQIQTCDGGVIKLQVNSLGNGDLQAISNLLPIADVQVKRSNTRLLILFIPRADSVAYSPEIIAAIESIQADILD